MFKKLRQNIVLASKALMWGLKGADEIQTSNKEEHEIKAEADLKGVFGNFLAGKETQEVKETRDAYYRVLKEADNYEVQIDGAYIKEAEDGENYYQSDENFKVTVKKKTNRFELPHSEVFNTKGYKVEVIQDKKTYENDEETRLLEAKLHREINDPRFEIFQIERDFTPKFPIEFKIQKAVVKKRDSGKRILDLYFSIYPKQFDKKDSLFIAEIKRIYDDIKYKSDMFDIKTFEFITDKCFGVENLHKFKFKIKKLRSIDIFDGNYVVCFDVDTLEDCDVTEKYKTEELDRKYKNNAPKKNPDINAVKRRNDEDSNRC